MKYLAFAMFATVVACFFILTPKAFKPKDLAVIKQVVKIEPEKEKKNETAKRHPNGK